MRDYYIAFDTKEIPNGLKATKVSLDSVLVLDMQKKFNIALCDDPLYPQLVAYVKANPAKAVR